MIDISQIAIGCAAFSLEPGTSYGGKTFLLAIVDTGYLVLLADFQSIFFAVSLEEDLLCVVCYHWE